MAVTRRKDTFHSWELDELNWGYYLSLQIQLTIAL